MTNPQYSTQNPQHPPPRQPSSREKAGSAKAEFRERAPGLPGLPRPAAAALIGPGASACASGANVVKTAPLTAGADAGGGDGMSANDGAA
jgi:hypothetical protein